MATRRLGDTATRRHAEGVEEVADEGDAGCREVFEGTGMLEITRTGPNYRLTWTDSQDSESTGRLLTPHDVGGRP